MCFLIKEKTGCIGEDSGKRGRGGTSLSRNKLSRIEGWDAQGVGGKKEKELDLPIEGKEDGRWVFVTLNTKRVDNIRESRFIGLDGHGKEKKPRATYCVGKRGKISLACAVGTEKAPIPIPGLKWG